MDGTNFSAPSHNPEIRRNLQKAAESDSGKAELFERLKVIDPETAEKISPNNLIRVIRALEIYEITGEKFSEYKRKNRFSEASYDFSAIYLNFPDRQQLYDRINRRVDIMLECGLLEECRQAFEAGISGTFTQAIGYKELIPFFTGEKTLDECIEKIKQATRNYAKRQLTWFRRDKRFIETFLN
jgi:tRNA dimethylallyltransferase